jgi:hypothetical protein
MNGLTVLFSVSMLQQDWGAKGVGAILVGWQVFWLRRAMRNL